MSLCSKLICLIVLSKLYVRHYAGKGNFLKRVCVCVCVAIMHDLMSINRYHHAKEGTGRPSVLFIACLSFCG